MPGQGSAWRSRERSRLLAMIALVALIVTACASDGEDEVASGDDGERREVEHSFMLASGSQPTQQIGQLLTFWTERVNERSQGGIEIDIAWLDELVGQGEELTATGDGRVDLMMATNLFTPGELPLSQVTTMPFTTYDGEAMPRALMDLYEENEAFRQEHAENNVHLVGVLPLDSAITFATDPWDTLEDLEDESIRAVGNIGQALDIVGAEVTALGTGEVYEALQRGAVNSGVIPLDGGRAFGWHEVAPHIRDVGLGQYLHMIMAINLDVWEGLSADDQEAFEGATQDMLDVVHEYFQEADSESCEDILESGGDVDIWSEEQIETFREEVGDTVEQEWVERTGPEAEEFLQRYRELLAEYEPESEWVSGVRECAERSGS